jgi:hypothetical protein
LNAGRARGDEGHDDIADGGTPDDLLRGDLLGRAQRYIRAFVLTALKVRACGVDEEGGLSLGEGDGVQVDGPGDVERGSGVAEGEGDVDPVQPGVGGAERGPGVRPALSQWLRRPLGDRWPSWRE